MKKPKISFPVFVGFTSLTVGLMLSNVGKIETIPAVTTTYGHVIALIILFVSLFLLDYYTRKESENN